jgi:hypothetical protein
MTIYAAFNELDGWGGIVGAVGIDVLSTTNSAVALSGVNRAGVALRVGPDHPDGGNTIYVDREFPPLTNSWLHMRLHRTIYSGGFYNTPIHQQPALRLTADNGVPLVELDYNTNAQNQQSAPLRLWVLGSNTGKTMLPPSATIDLDIHYLAHNTNGRIDVYVGGVLEHSFVGNTLPSGATGLGSLRVWAVGLVQTGDMMIAHVVLADEPTVGARVYTIPLEAVGAQNDWDGSLSNVNGPDLSDATNVSATADGQTLLATQNGIGAIGSGFRIGAVVVSTRAVRGSGAPTGLTPVFRTASGTVLTGPTSNVGTIIGPVQMAMQELPGAGRPFIESDFTGAQIGFRAAGP